MENLKRFAKTTEIKSVNEKTEEWRKWKRDQVTETVRLLAARARAINPDIQFSTTGCAPYVRAREEAFQDWGKWLNLGYVDFVTMMNYPNNLEEFKKYIAGAQEKVDSFNKVYLGVGAYKFLEYAAAFAEMWSHCETEGSKGCVVFYYGSLRESAPLKKTLIEQAGPNDRLPWETDELIEEEVFEQEAAPPFASDGEIPLDN